MEREKAVGDIKTESIGTFLYEELALEPSVVTCITGGVSTLRVITPVGMG